MVKELRAFNTMMSNFERQVRLARRDNAERMLLDVNGKVQEERSRLEILLGLDSPLGYYEGREALRTELERINLEGEFGEYRERLLERLRSVNNTREKEWESWKKSHKPFQKSAKRIEEWALGKCGFFKDSLNSERAESVMELFAASFRQPPVPVVLTDRYASTGGFFDEMIGTANRILGYYYYPEQVIELVSGGHNFGTLIHELAHHLHFTLRIAYAPRSSGVEDVMPAHGVGFYLAYCDVLDWATSSSSLMDKSIEWGWW